MKVYRRGILGDIESAEFKYCIRFPALQLTEHLDVGDDVGLEG